MDGEPTVQLRLKKEPEIPLEAEVLTPDVCCSLSNREIQELPAMLGKHPCRLGDFFEVEGERSRCLEIHGDLGKVKWIGRAMTDGSIRIHGNAGMHLGSAMTGGAIVVSGNAGDWLGAEMRGGRICVRGNAGGQVGAAYRGSRRGMRGGVIHIEGDAGLEVAMRMRRGMICIRGRVGDFAGLQMLGGTLLLCGKAGIRTGAWMSRGTIVALEPLKLLPTFFYACTYEPVFLRLLANQLADSGLPGLGEKWNYRVQRYIGDTSGLSKGEILVCEPASPSDDTN